MTRFWLTLMFTATFVWGIYSMLLVAAAEPVCEKTLSKAQQVEVKRACKTIKCSEYAKSFYYAECKGNYIEDTAYEKAKDFLDEIKQK